MVEGVPITLIDTAGIRRRGRIEPGVEKWSVMRSLQAIRRSDVALLMVDVTSGLTNQDAHIAGFVLDEWKSCVILINKWDAIQKDSYTMDEYTRQVRRELNFLDYVPVLFISAMTGQRVDKVLPLALQVQEERLVRLSTSQINKILGAAQDRHPHPGRAGKQFKIYYGTQVRSDPPTFLLYVNDPDIWLILLTCAILKTAYERNTASSVRLSVFFCALAVERAFLPFDLTILFINH
jgi:GTPase